MTIQSLNVTDARGSSRKQCWSRPKNIKTVVTIVGIIILVIGSALAGYFIGRAHYVAWKFGEPPDPVDELLPSASWLHVFQKAAVCTDAPHCSLIGRQILIKNGSAVDAAIAAMFCNGILNQQSMGIGGGFFMTVYIKAEEEVFTLNAREKAPSAATRDMFNGNSDKSTKVVGNPNYRRMTGPLSVGVPGEVRGMWAAHQRWGKLPWRDLVEPTLTFCKSGFAMSRALSDGILSAPFIQNDPILRNMYYDNWKKTFHNPGTIVKPSEALCNTLSIIAEKGGDELYNGTLAQNFAKDLERAGSIITLEDLNNYQPKITKPLVVQLFDGDTLYAPPPPSSGPILAQILNILSGYHFNATNINGTSNQILTYHRILEAFKYGYSTRTKLGDTDYLDLKELLSNVTSPEIGKEIRLRINDSSTSNDTSSYGAEVYATNDGGTAHISVIGSNGDAVSITSSINYYFGAGFTTRDTGIVMNNVMDDFSSPGITNYFGLKPSEANFIVPGKRPLSSMSPSIILDANRNAKIVIGASGGTKIISAIALVVMRQLWFGQNVKEAVDAPRIHHQVFPIEAHYEYGITEDIVKGLREKGHGMVRYRGRGSIVCALYRNKTGIYANADFRKGGDVAGMD